MARANRNSLINMRTTEIEKEFLQKAAEIAGYSNLTNFIMTAARKEAANVLNEVNTTYLSRKDWDKVVDLLNQPPEPNAYLKKLLDEKE